MKELAPPVAHPRRGVGIIGELGLSALFEAPGQEQRLSRDLFQTRGYTHVVEMRLGHERRVHELQAGTVGCGSVWVGVVFVKFRNPDIFNRLRVPGSATVDLVVLNIRHPVVLLEVLIER